MDFGLVKLWDPRDPRTRTVVRGMGTPEYAPPEQYEMAAGHTDPRSDIYSLGATLYHSLTGQAPPTATLRMADPEQFRPPRNWNSRINPKTEQAVLKAMELNRGLRWPNAAEMARALRLPVPAWQPIPASSSWKATQKIPFFPGATGPTAGTSAIAQPMPARRRMLVPAWLLIGLVAFGVTGTLIAALTWSKIGGKVTPTPTLTTTMIVTIPVNMGATNTPLPSPTATATLTRAPVPTRTPVPTAPPSPTPTSTRTPRPTPKPTNTPTPTETPPPPPPAPPPEENQPPPPTLAPP